MEHTLTMSTTGEARQAQLFFSGSCTITEARLVKDILLEAIDQVDHLYLDLQGIGAVDVSFIQLLCAAHRECFLSDKEIYIQEQPGIIMNTFLATAGYTKQCGCLSGAKKSCLWSKCATDSL